MTSLLGGCEGVRGRESVGLPAPLPLNMASFMELFLFRELLEPYPGNGFFRELVSEFCLLYP